MATYKLKHADTNNIKNISVLEDDTNGYASPSSTMPYVPASTGRPAAGQDSSLVFVGRSLHDYGETIQNNLLYLLENFASPKRPMSPMEGQVWYKNTNGADPVFTDDPVKAGLYVYTKAKWVSIVLSSGSVADLNMDGHKIVNLGDPTQPGDAVNLRTADGRYLKLTGGTVTGLTTFTGNVQVPSGSALNLIDLPTSGNNATNKTYVDKADERLVTMINDLSSGIATDLTRYVRKAGDTMTGTLVLDPAAGLTVSPGTGVVSMGSRRIQSLGEPVHNTDATTRFYVDNAISSAINSMPPPVIPNDIYVTSGNVSDETGLITLIRSAGAAPVRVTGAVALKDHVHTGDSLKIVTNANYGLSTIATAVADSLLSTPEDTLSNVVRVLDQAITDVRRPRHRWTYTQTGSTVLYALPPHMSYQVDQCSLDVYVNGIKYIANDRGLGVINFGNPVLLRSPICDDGAFTLNIGINGVNYALNLNANRMSILSFADALAIALEVKNAPVSVQLEQTMSSVYVYLKTTTSGVGSSVNLSQAVSVLNSKFFDFVSANSYTAQLNAGYTEVGEPGDVSTQFRFNSVLPAGSVIEVITS